MASRLVWDGLDELRRELRNLPADLADDASDIVNAAAQEAASEIRSGYEQHHHSGNLADHVKVQSVQAGPFGAAVLVKSTAAHAHIFENGTQIRRTGRGANRGAMPPGNVFIPIVVRKRRAMYDKLRALVAHKGLVPSGEP